MSPVGAALSVLGPVVALAMPAGALAQTCTAQSPPATPWTCTVNTSASLTVGDVLQLTLSSTSTTLTAPGVTDYDAGFVENTGPTATVRGNRAWRLQISAATATWSATDTEPGVNARSNKPAADLLWSTVAGGGGPFTALSTTPATATAENASAGSGSNFFLRTLYAWSLDTPGAYSLAVVFTLVAP